MKRSPSHSRRTVAFACNSQPTTWISQQQRTGIHLLATTIRDWTEDAKIATQGSPTQAQIIEALREQSWGEEKRLAGSRQAPGRH